MSATILPFKGKKPVAIEGNDAKIMLVLAADLMSDIPGGAGNIEKDMVPPASACDGHMIRFRKVCHEILCIVTFSMSLLTPRGSSWSPAHAHPRKGVYTPPGDGRGPPPT